MMFSKSNDVLDRLQKLRDAFSATLPEKLNAVDILWQNVKQQGIGSTDNTADLYRAVHSLAGSAGTFGHPELGQAARQLEQTIKQHLNDTGALSETVIHVIDTELHQFVSWNITSAN
jgi:HPt (histidine-containing phosphotransfer) domain-containing protein